MNLDFAEYLEAELEDGRTIVIPCFPWKWQSEWTGRYNICWTWPPKPPWSKCHLKQSAELKPWSFTFWLYLRRKPLDTRLQETFNVWFSRDFYVIFWYCGESLTFFYCQHVHILNCQGWSVERYNRPSVTLCFSVDSNLGKLKITRLSANSVVESNDVSVTLLMIWMKFRVIDPKKKAAITDYQKWQRKIWWDEK